MKMKRKKTRMPLMQTTERAAEAAGRRSRCDFGSPSPTGRARTRRRQKKTQKKKMQKHLQAIDAADRRVAKKLRKKKKDAASLIASWMAIADCPGQAAAAVAVSAAAVGRTVSAVEISSRRTGT